MRVVVLCRDRYYSLSVDFELEMDVFEFPQKNRAFIRWHTPYINRVYLFPLLVLLSSTLEKTFPSHLPKKQLQKRL